jgi:beta-N-acetylhexosaminidase
MPPRPSLSDDQLAGQRIMAGFDGQQLNDDLRHLIRDLKVGGLILFAPNIAEPGQLTALCREAQAFARACGQPPLFIAVDQEGGPVARLKKPFTEFPGNPHLRTRAAADRFARITARELSAVGINMDMAPVVDVAAPGMGGIMAGRAFSDDPARVADLGATVIRRLQSAGVMAVAKHFPGIGRTELDSHVEMPVARLSEGDLEAVDLAPFRAAQAAGVAGIMVAHILYERLDPLWPASLSPAIARRLLRERLGYRGLTITDDLDMGAIGRNFDIPTAVRQILEADIDIVLICHAGPNIAAAWEEVRRRLADDPARRADAHRSAARILGLKGRFLASTHKGKGSEGKV